MKHIMMIPSYQFLLAIRFNQHHPIIKFFALTGQMSADDDTDRVFRAVFAFEHIKFRILADILYILNIAQLGIIGRQCNKRLNVCIRRPYPPFRRMIRSHSTKSIRIIGCKTGNYQITVSCRIVYCNFSLVTNHYYIRIFSQLLVNRFFVVSIACKTSPINHHTGRTFQQSYHICLRFISEFIFLEISHILIGNKMNTACIGRYGCCKFSRLFSVGSDCCRRSCYK